MSNEQKGEGENSLSMTSCQANSPRLTLNDFTEILLIPESSLGPVCPAASLPQAPDLKTLLLPNENPSSSSFRPSKPRKAENTAAELSTVRSPNCRVSITNRSKPSVPIA